MKEDGRKWGQNQQQQNSRALGSHSVFDESDLASLGNPRSVLTLHLAGLPCLALLPWPLPRARGWMDGESSFLLGIFLRFARVLCFGNIVFFGPSRLKMYRVCSLFFSPRLRVRSEGGSRCLEASGCVPQFAGLICPRRLYDLKFSSFRTAERAARGPAPAKSRYPPRSQLYSRFPRAVITL